MGEFPLIRRCAAVAAALVFALVAACGPDGPAATPAPSPSPTGTEPRSGTLLTVTRTGGIAGRRHSVAVGADGTVEARVGPSGEPETGRMPGERLAGLREVLAGEEFGRLPRRTFDEPSPDTYVYEFATPERAVLADDTSLPDPLPELLELVGPWLRGRP